MTEFSINTHRHSADFCTTEKEEGPLPWLLSLMDSVELRNLSAIRMAELLTPKKERSGAHSTK